jgi:hypothetical protein
MTSVEKAAFVVYISGVITSLGDVKENIARFFAAQCELHAQGFNTYNPAALHMEDWTQDDYMQYYTACVLPACSAIYMMLGWRDSAGAREEHQWALDHDMHIIYEGLE